LSFLELRQHVADRVVAFEAALLHEEVPLALNVVCRARRLLRFEDSRLAVRELFHEVLGHPDATVPILRERDKHLLQRGGIRRLSPRIEELDVLAAVEVHTERLVQAFNVLAAPLLLQIVGAFPCVESGFGVERRVDRQNAASEAALNDPVLLVLNEEGSLLHISGLQPLLLREHLDLNRRGLRRTYAAAGRAQLAG